MLANTLLFVFNLVERFEEYFKESRKSFQDFFFYLYNIYASLVCNF